MKRSTALFVSLGILFVGTALHADDTEEDWKPRAMTEVIVTVTSNPEGALVLLDGHLHCRSTPCARLVPPGSYLFSVLHERCETSDRKVDIMARTDLRFALELCAKNPRPDDPAK